MELTGKIIAVLPERGGTSTRTGNTWKSQEFVIETINEQYPRKCVFTVFGEDRLSQMNIQLNEILTVSFDIDAHEYNGRWFNDIRAWKVDRQQAQQPMGVNPMDAQAFPPGVPPVPGVGAMPAADFSKGGEDDLPF